MGIANKADSEGGGRLLVQATAEDNTAMPEDNCSCLAGVYVHTLLRQQIEGIAF